MPGRSIQWDIYEEHLEEAAFVWDQWEQVLSAWTHTLPEVASGPENRLLAHLDALVIGGSAVADELARPALQSDDLAQVAAAAWVLAHDEEQDRLDDVWAALSLAAPPRRDALARALALSHRSDLAARSLAGFDVLAPALQAGVIDILRVRGDGALSSLPLARLSSHPDPELLGAVLRAVRRVGVDIDRSAIARGLASELPDTRAAAIELGTLLNLEVVRPSCRSIVAERAPEGRVALAALAIGGDPQDQQRLLDWVSGDLALDALWALGFSGRPSVAEALLGYLTDPRLGASAAESFGAITGLVLDGDFVNPEPPESGELADDEPIPEPHPADGLPQPNAPAVVAWWRQNAGRFEGTRRYFRGQTWSSTLPASALRGTATWRLRGARLGLSRSEASHLELRGWARDCALPAEK